MKNLRTGVMFLLLSLVLCSCHVSEKNAPPHSKIVIGEYIFSVEEAKGDQHNVRIIYSLVRQDGENIDPEAHFEWLLTDDFHRSASSGIEYQLSDDGKTIWVIEEQSSAQKYDSDTLYTVNLENLMFGDDSNHETIEGSWAVSYKIKIDEEYTEVLHERLKIQFPEDKSYYCELYSIQISSMGIHIEMKVPDSDVVRLSEKFTCALMFADGTIVELEERRHSVRSSQWKDLYNAYCEKLFDEQINLDNVCAVIVCGQEIYVTQGGDLDGIFALAWNCTFSVE